MSLGIKYLRSATAYMPANPKAGEVVTVVAHELGVVDLSWNPDLDKWVLLRVLKKFVR